MTYDASFRYQKQDEIVVVYTPLPHVVDIERDDEDDDDFEFWQVGLERLENSWYLRASGWYESSCSDSFFLKL